MNMNMNCALKAVPRSKQSPTLDKLLTLLGGSVRLALLRELLVESKSVSTLADAVDHSIGLVSHNLKLLREQGLVVSTPSARHRYYSLAPGVNVEHHAGGTKLGFTTADCEQVHLMLKAPTRVEDGDIQAVQVQKTAIDRFKNQPQPGDYKHHAG